MKTPRPTEPAARPARAFWAVLLFLALAAGRLAAAEPAATAKPGGKVTAPDPVSELKPDMTAEAVEKLMGRPAETKAMASPEGHAEIWTYRREVAHRIERVEVGSVPITYTTIDSNGKPHTIVLGDKTQFSDAHITTVETIELLLFNGHYVTMKSSRREVRTYN